MAARAHHGVLARLLSDDQRVGELGVRTEISTDCYKHRPVAASSNMGVLQVALIHTHRAPSNLFVIEELRAGAR